MSDRITLSGAGLILGGARSGKSEYAERLVDQSQTNKVYIATGQAGDVEMRARIATHRARRGKDWSTIEEPLDLAGAIRTHASHDRGLLVDCLTLWLSNLMGEGRDIDGETDALIAVLRENPGPVALVSNEVGLGIVPENAMARAFRDHQGRLNQRVAEAAELVVFMAAGLPLIMKSPEWDPIKKDML